MNILNLNDNIELNGKIWKQLAILFLTASSLTGLHAHAESLPSVTDFRIEAREAMKKKVPILVLFMSNSCHYCEIVLEDYLLPMQKDPAFQDKVILRQIETSSEDKLIDFDGTPTTQGDFAGKRKIWGVPQVFLYDSEGNVLTSIAGLLTQDFYYAYLEDAIENSLQQIRGK